MKITDFGYNGEGVGHLEDKVCFVPYTLLGEDVDVVVTKETSSFCNAKIDSIVNPSPLRKTPPCPYFAKCGGCDFQHMDYDTELELKGEIIKRQLSKIGYNGEIKLIKSEKEYGYRNKIRLFCNKKGLGLKRAQSDEIVNISKCLLIDNKMNFALEKVNAFIVSNKIQDAVSNVVIRRFGKQYAVWLVYNKKVDVEYVGLSLVLGNDFCIYVSTKEEKPELVQGGVGDTLEFGFKIDQPVDVFRQVNDKVASQLYNAVLENVGDGTVANAYSGAGLLSALIAKRCKKVYAIELGDSEHQSAEKLRAVNGINNLTNIHGDCAEEIGRINDKLDSIVLDPPRAGCDKNVISAIDSMDCEKVIYISCNAATLVRDIGRLHSFALVSVSIYDMFPRTANCELLAVLRKKPQ